MCQKTNVPELTETNSEKLKTGKSGEKMRL